MQVQQQVEQGSSEEAAVMRGSKRKALVFEDTGSGEGENEPTSKRQRVEEFSPSFPLASMVAHSPLSSYCFPCASMLAHSAFSSDSLPLASMVIHSPLSSNRLPCASMVAHSTLSSNWPQKASALQEAAHHTYPTVEVQHQESMVVHQVH